MAPDAAHPLSRLRRLLSSNEQIVADELRKQTEESGAVTIAEALPRTRVVLQGTIALITLNPRSGKRWLEAQLRDGTGTVTLIWMGRRMIPGLQPGRLVRVRGLISDVAGRPAIYNPDYELLR